MARTLTVAVQMDPMESIGIDGDSTFALMLEAQARGHTLWHYEVRHMSLREGVQTPGAVPRARRPQQSFARLLPIPSVEYPTPAHRPCNSRLDCTKLAQRFGLTLPAWESSMAQVMEMLAAEVSA